MESGTPVRVGGLEERKTGAEGDTVPEGDGTGAGLLSVSWKHGLGFFIPSVQAQITL